MGRRKRASITGDDSLGIQDRIEEQNPQVSQDNQEKKKRGRPKKIKHENVPNGEQVTRRNLVRSAVQEIVELDPSSNEEDAVETQSDAPASESTRRKRKRRRKRSSVPEDAISRIKRQVKYFFIRMKMEQNLIDAYSNEGWKGNSREKVRPEKELQRAQAQITKSKLRIREVMHELDTMLLEGSIRDSAFDDDGQLDYQEIFCAKCHSHDAEVDNDIILCDGACNRGFHQRCLTPPLATKDIPPGDEGWLCPACECKADCVSFLNDHVGTDFEVETNWENFFPEAVSGNGVDVASKDMGSDESDDDDYDPENKVQVEKEEAAANGEDEDKQPSSSDSSDNEGLENAGSQGSDDDLGSEDLSDEDLDEFLKEAQNTDQEGEGSEGSRQEKAENAPPDADDSGEGTLAVSGKRRRRDVDYRKLHDEMFGKGSEPQDGQQSEDEDWGPLKRQRKACGSSQRAKSAAVDTPLDGRPGSAAAAGDDKSKRIPKHAVERLRGAFAENQLPSRSFKEKLSRELGLSYRKVDVWFKNVRCQALRQGLAQPIRSSPWKLKKHTPATNGVHNRSLLRRLGEIQFKLFDMRKTMEAVQRPEDFELYPNFRGLENMVVDVRRGKRVMYVPEAQVVEKER